MINSLYPFGRALLKDGALRDAILNSPDFSIIATDEKGIIQFFNVGAERMLGYAAAEAVDRVSPSDIHDPDEVIEHARALSVEFDTPITPGFEALVFKPSRGVEDRYELTYIRKDGSRFPAVISVTALRGDDGTLIGYLLIGIDNSARKLVESELIEAMAAADRANRAKSDFLSGMSHELRSPLNAILGFAQLLDTGVPAPTPGQKRNLDHILKAGWYLLELIDQVLDLALIESGRLTLSQEPVSIDEVLQECRALIGPDAGNRGIRLVFPAPGAARYIHADRIRFKQILINLLSNAIKYNLPDGSVFVECSQPRPGTMRIVVRDTGAGLTAVQLSQLFQPFNRLGREGGIVEGSGIGLVVTKRLVDRLGGSIGAHSEAGAGSRFWVEFALASAPGLGAGKAAGARRGAAREPAAQPTRTLLYVEDNPANLELVEQLVARRADLRFISAADGSTGIQMARAHLPDVILMDINLPDLSGLDAVQMLRVDPVTADIPVIALSANAMPRDIRIGMEAGFCDYLTKPIRVDLFMDALDAVLARQHPSAGPAEMETSE